MIRFLRVDCDGEHSERDAAYLEISVELYGDIPAQVFADLSAMDWIVMPASDGGDLYYCPDCALVDRRGR